MLDFDYIDWTGPAEEHIAAADLTIDEVESVLYSPDVEHGRSRSTNRPVIFGTTDTGKRIIIVYEIKTRNKVAVLEVVTAYPIED